MAVKSHQRNSAGYCTCLAGHARALALAARVWLRRLARHQTLVEVAHLSRFRPLALFVRLPSARVGRVVMQASAEPTAWWDHPSIGPARRVGWQPFPAMPPYFCRLNQYCIAMEARVGSRRSAAPEARELYLRGASPAANSIAPGDATQGRRVTAQRTLTYSASHSDWPFLDGGSCGRGGD